MILQAMPTLSPSAPSPARRRRAPRALAACLLALLLVTACDDDDDPVGPTEEELAALPTQTITVTGGFGMLDQSLHTFTAVQSGFVRMTLTELGPLETVTIGIGVGQPSTTTDEEGQEVIGNCVLLASDRSVNLGDSLLTNGTIAGIEYCVTVFDVGNLFEGNSVTYTMTIEHT